MSERGDPARDSLSGMVGTRFSVAPGDGRILVYADGAR